jgi:tRNA(Met) C34 N-acetyltransferase TmcA
MNKHIYIYTYIYIGDMIPWTISQQFSDNEFATLSGARVVRIATHPDVQKMGYGSRAMDLLLSYFQVYICKYVYVYTHFYTGTLN